MIVEDEDFSDTVQFSIIEGNEYFSFNINATSGQLSFSKDYNITSSESPTCMNITIQCMDSGGLTDTAVVCMSIFDVNEAPTFINLPAMITVSEDVNTEFPVFKVLIGDLDGDELSLIMTSKSAVTSSLFILNRTGIINSAYQFFVLVEIIALCKYIDLSAYFEKS